MTRRHVKLFVGTVVLLYLAYLAIIVVMQDRIVYPGAGFAFEAPPPPPGVERWVETTAVGEVHAFFAPADAEGAPGVVLLHGNMEAAEHLFGLMSVYRRRGFSVLVPEYRGYRGAAGAPTEEGIASDLAVFTARFEADAHVDEDRIVYHGTSLGGAVAGALARRRAPRALILQSTFTSISGIARTRLAPGFLARDRYDTIGLLATSEIPVLILHGTEDPVIPVSHAHDNAHATRHGTLLLLPGGHGIPIGEESAKTYWRQIFEFLAANGVK